MWPGCELVTTISAIVLVLGRLRIFKDSPIVDLWFTLSLTFHFSGRCCSFLNKWVTHIKHLYAQVIRKYKEAGHMASEAPTWADQWGAGGIGAMDDDSTTFQKETGKNKNSGAKSGFSKVKATASNCVKWMKNLCKRKRASN